MHMVNLMRKRNICPVLEGQRPKYPVCFLTNGGGVTEEQKAEQLSGWLDVDVGVDQVIV